ncbi:MAG: PaeR7I family type II restriction endonuclease [Terriglobales bacterium]
MPLAPDIQSRLRAAVRQFWTVRKRQSAKQGGRSGTRDAGERAAVTGGAQMDGFVGLVRELLCECGMARASVHCESHLELPGWYRAEKQWDLIVISDGAFLAGIEFKSQVGPSFGNNFNNRSEEALGSATDLWAAYREGAFRPSSRPWLGYLMLLEDCPSSNAPVRSREPHFRVFDEFRNASYAKRYELLLTKMVRERMYDSVCLLLARGEADRYGEYREPSEELRFEAFIASLLAKALAAGRASNRG